MITLFYPFIILSQTVIFSSLLLFDNVRLWSTWKGGDSDHLITRLRKIDEFDPISNCITNSKFSSLLFVFGQHGKAETINT